MIFRKKSREILRQPKIYTAPRELEKKPFPKLLKVTIFVFIAIIVLIYLIFISPLFKITNINLLGTPSNESIAHLETFKGENIFRINAMDLEKVLKEQNVQFSDVDVSLGIPGTLRVKFVERLPVIIWQTNSKNYLVDKNAIAYQEMSGTSDLIIVIDNKNILIEPPAAVATSNFIDFLKVVMEKTRTLDLKVTKFEVDETTFQVAALTDKNIKIIFDTTRSITDQLNAAKFVYDAKKDEIKQYMDVRVEGKVYYQ